jgi:hypothetical protein
MAPSARHHKPVIGVCLPCIRSEPPEYLPARTDVAADCRRDDVPMERRTEKTQFRIGLGFTVYSLKMFQPHIFKRTHFK